MHYRDGKTIYSSMGTDGQGPWQAETFASINKAKAESRVLSVTAGRIVVRRGKPPNQVPDVA